jgi:hypothetical protein
LPGPRIVELCFAENSRSTQYDFVTTEFPEILHVTQESRKEALRSYQLAFYRPKYSIPVYFNFKTDILLLRLVGSSSTEYLGKRSKCQMPKVVRRLVDKEKVQNLAIPLEVDGESMSRFMLYFPNLESVTILRPLPLLIFHLGKCHYQRSCFTQPDETFDGDGLPDTDFYHSTEIQLASFLNDWRSGILSFPDWREPVFKYAVLCQDSPIEKHFWCPPLSTLGRQIQTRSLV